ncbi:MAG: HPr kinase/phosphatase C-terminal domain-containing protein [Paracoccaceae bacterium]
MGPAHSEILHATSVSAQGRGVLICGPSGSGKSALALQMMALGARLISDDQTEVYTTEAGLRLRCPSTAIRGLIEARGIGLLRVDPLPDAPLSLVVNLAQDETERLPPQRQVTILGQQLPLLLQVQNNHFPAALMVYLCGERQD